MYTAGQKIGPYEIIDSLKQTRFGQTYLGQRGHQNERILIEVFQPLLSNTLERRFLSQVRGLMQLEHPHILPMRDAGIQGHDPFLVTDFGPYRLLREVYPSGSQQSLELFLPYLKQLASALHYAHSRGVAHGDLRPENILFDKNNGVLLTGFMIEALFQNQKRHKDQPAGVTHKAPSLGAPEKGQANPASDEYWLAALTYELLSGDLPFTESASSEEDTPFLLLRQRVPDISAGVEKVLMKALERVPEQRFTDVVAFVNSLEEQQRQSQVAERKRLTPASPLLSVEDANETTLQMSVQPALPKHTLGRPTPASTDAPSPILAQETNSSQRALNELESEDTHPLQSPPTRTRKSRRKDDITVTRRSFAVGLVSLATLGGAGGWYLFEQRLSASVGGGNGLSAAQPATRTTTHHTNVLIFTGHSASVNALAWSPDGKLIASASDDASVQIFHASSGQRSVTYTGHSEEVATVDWSSHGQFIASGGQDGTVQIWNAVDGGKILTYTGHASRVNGVSWSRNSQLLASGSEDKSVQVWNASNGSLNFNFLGHTAGVLCVGWQPNNSSVASGSWDGTLRDWAVTRHGDHFAPGDQIFSYSGHGKSEVDALSWSPSGTLIASAGTDQTVQISKGKDGTSSLPFFTRHKNQSHANLVLSVAWSPDGSAIASGDTNGTVYIWKAADQTPFFVYQGHTGAVNALTWSPDGKMLASAGADTTVQVWQPG